MADIRPIAEIAQRAGVAIECCTFIGSSPLRQYAEGWGLDQLLALTEEAIGFAVREGLTVMYVTEDTTRADPDTLRQLYSTAIRAGATRVCIADTVGHATPRARRRWSGSSRRWSTTAAAASASTGTATATATLPSSTPWPRSRRARRASTAPRSASASASATRRWIRCS